MDVANFETEDREPHLLGLVDLVEGASDRMGDAGEMLHQLGPKIGPGVDLVTRNDEGVSGLERSDRQKGNTDVILPNEMSRHLAVDDLREDTRHRSHSSCRPIAKRASIRHRGKELAGLTAPENTDDLGPGLRE